MRYAILASSSKGNCIYVESGNTNLLVDCGLTAKGTEKALHTIGVCPTQIDAILISHEHNDHVGGVRLFNKKYGTMVYSTRETFAMSQELRAVPKECRKRFRANVSFVVGELVIHPFSVMHDAVNPVGFRIECSDKSLAIATDLGIVTPLVVSSVRGVDTLIIEMNHEPAILAQSPYPQPLKRRIAEMTGHLNNQCVTELLRALGEESPSFVVAAHASDTNNTLNAIRRALPYGAHIEVGQELTNV